MSDSPRYQPQTDKRIPDLGRFLHDRRREAGRTCALVERSRARDPAEQLHYWHCVFSRVERQIERLRSPNKDEEEDVRRRRADEHPDEHRRGGTERVEVVERWDA